MTEANKREYANLVARHVMTTSIRPQLTAFLSGFWELARGRRPPPGRCCFAASARSLARRPAQPPAAALRPAPSPLVLRPAPSLAAFPSHPSSPSNPT